MSKSKICYFRDKKDHFTAIYRVFYPATALEHHKCFDITFCERADYDYMGDIVTPALLEADVIVTGQAFLPARTNSEAAARVDTMYTMMKRLKDMGKKIVYDADDLYIEPPKHGSKVHNDAVIAETIKATQLADVVTVVSPYLGEMLHKMAKVPRERIRYIPNLYPVDFAKQLYQECGLQRLENIRQYGGKVRIGMMGTINHYADYNAMKDVFVQLREKYGNKITFELFGLSQKDYDLVEKATEPPELLKQNMRELWQWANELGFIWHEQRKKDRYDFYEYMCSLGWDIALAPLSNTRADKSKSFLKWMDYSMAGIAGVYKGISPYTDVIDGENGLTANSTTEWVDAISSLIDHPEKRESIVSTAKKQIEKEFNIDRQYTYWEDAIKSSLA